CPETPPHARSAARRSPRAVRREALSPHAGRGGRPSPGRRYAPTRPSGRSPRAGSLPRCGRGEAMTPRLAILAMLGAMLIYGANFGLSRHALLHGLTPDDLVAMRYGIAGVAL